MDFIYNYDGLLNNVKESTIFLHCKKKKTQKTTPLKTTIRTFKETDCTALKKYHVFVFIHCFRRLQAIILVGNNIIHINVSRLFRKVICGSGEGGVTLLFVENY